MSPVSQNLTRILFDIERRDPELAAEISSTLKNGNSKHISRRFPELMALEMPPHGLEGLESIDQESIALEAIIKAQFRPVLTIRNNKLVMEFVGPDSDVWKKRLESAKSRIDSIIPSVGRIELVNDNRIPYAGTGWMLGEEVVVTNRHVANLFAQRNGRKYVFSTARRGQVTAKIDFLEELDRSESLEFPVVEVLWISDEGEDIDIAFLKIGRVSGQAMPDPIVILDKMPEVDQYVAAIGYPARDSRSKDQDLASRIFKDVYNKKRLAPGQIIGVERQLIEHDCTTLGGNSGSVIVDLHSGKAVALHYAGEWMTKNSAVPGAIVKDRLARLGRALPVHASEDSFTFKPVEVDRSIVEGTEHTFDLNIPVHISVRIGNPYAPQTNPQPIGPAEVGPNRVKGIESAVAEARRMLRGRPGVVGVRKSYGFKSGWITDEPIVLVELEGRSAREGVGLPSSIGGFSLETVTADTTTESISELEGFFLERFIAGNYVPPNFSLSKVDKDMVATFHASPDHGFPVLKEFLSKTRKSITATMYEFDADHVLNVLVEAVKPRGRRLKMVTHYKDQSMVDAIERLSKELGNRFDHQWASVGKSKIFASAYHIKVAVRDSEAIWLSSGNWKNSGQPNIDPAGQDWTTWDAYRKHNREWHVVIENKELAEQFERFIEYDFDEAERVPKFEEGVEEAFEAPVEVFVPTEMLEAPRKKPEYQMPLALDQKIKIQPLLTPDNYLAEVKKLIASAKKSIYFENQSLNPSFDRDGNDINQDEFREVMELLAEKQQEMDVRVIVRDGREFPGGKTKVIEQLRRLKAMGFDTDRVKLQRGCHTKGIIVDSKVVLLGSHNWTNEGTLSNRDASLIVYEREVAEYYERLFLFDWENLAKQDLSDEIEEVRIADPGEPTPQGMTRINLRDLMD